ncbi:GrlR family regulatory protein [Pandoraea sputorum]|uniref:T3SS negative regulator,GrlR n=1 Tax=Pandoraea sputorum TaxID=93222 RepID=A0A5E5BGE6_9BURK|nr:GrlR family regulatory protein [Pandoraea sputorum]VVE84989.1 hypothetical protein PSP31121_05029 [Pandoraea sputorum]
MAKDGFYKVDFGALIQGAGGIVVIEGGKIRGGDDQYLYSGTASTQGNSISAELRVAAYAATAESVFGTRGGAFNLVLQGDLVGDGFVVTGKSPTGAGPDIVVRATRIAELTL